tara:strand:- start:153 stop:386 length:234 start_codon:yes stop_codon:yes gene_type:complete
MFIQIAPRVKVFVTKKQIQFINKHSDYSFRSTELQPDEVQLAKVLADKAIFVRKKLDNDVQYALNKSIKFVMNDKKR